MLPREDPRIRRSFARDDVPEPPIELCRHDGYSPLRDLQPPRQQVGTRLRIATCLVSYSSSITPASSHPPPSPSTPRDRSAPAAAR
jgi:hypothetical protein